MTPKRPPRPPETPSAFKERPLDDGGRVRVEYERRYVGGAEDWRLVATRVEIEHPDGIGTALLRSVPLAEMDRDVNQPALSGEGGPEAEARRLTPVRRPTTYADEGGEDAFYAHLVARYLTVMLRTSKPAVQMAAESEVPVTTVHRWVREARRRGALPPARPGAAG